MAFDAYVRRAVEKGKVIFPVMYCGNCADPAHESMKCLECLLRTKGEYEFNCQYSNDPLDEGTIEFKRPWIQRFAWSEEKARELSGVPSIISVDPAFRLKETNDFTGLVVTKTPESGLVHVMEAQAIKASPEQVVDEIFKAVDRFSPVAEVIVETVAAQILLLPLLEAEMRKRKVFFNLTEAKTTTKETKAMRIRSLIPYYANGQILHRDGLTTLENQLIAFPRNAFDDVIDALSMQSHKWQAPFKRTHQGGPAPYTGAWWEKQIPKRQDRVARIFKGVAKRKRRI